jgi:hypothetical protein
MSHEPSSGKRHRRDPLGHRLGEDLDAAAAQTARPPVK